MAGKRKALLLELKLIVVRHIPTMSKWVTLGPTLQGSSFFNDDPD